MTFPRNFRIDDVEFNYPKLATPFKNRFGSVQFEVQIVLKDKAQAEMLKKEHLNVREKDGVFSINLKRAATRQDGTENGAPRVVDASLSPVDSTRIGNGSRGNVIIRQYEYDFGGNKGVGSMLEAVQITEMKEYTPEARVDFDVVAEAPTVNAAGEEAPLF